MTTMNRPKTVAVLTGGGDVPGLNPCIKTIVYRGIEEEMRVIGIKRGWAGLLNYNPEDPESFDANLAWLDKQMVRTIDRSGGTYLHTSRTNPGAVSPKDLPEFLRDRVSSGTERADLTDHILKNLSSLEVDILIPIGGEDTLGFAERLHREGFPVIAIPKTMDNDVFGTDYCIGFSTAVTRSVNSIHSLRTSIGSHERIGVIEVFGRESGETCLVSAYLAGVDRAIISEVPFEPEKLARMIMEDKRANPANYAIITISEGAKMIGGTLLQRGEADAYGHRKLGGSGIETGEALKRLTGADIIFQQLSYLMRSGGPDSLDLMVAGNFANMAMTLALKRITGRMGALSNGIYTDIPLSTVTSGQKRVDVPELYDVDQYRPKVRYVTGKPMFLY